MGLRFVRKRRVEGMQPGQAEGWLAAEPLDELDRKQLLDIAAHSSTKGLTPEVAFERLVGGGYDVHHTDFDELGAVPLEQWDILDGETLVYHLWLYLADGGVLYEAGSTEALGGMVQGHLDPYELRREQLAELESGRLRAVEQARTHREFPCELSHYRFARG